METARTAKYAFLAISISVAALVFPQNTWAASGNVQICQPNTSCTIGEFLYDDSYTPIIDATCTITSRYPDGSLLFDAVALTPAPQNDGWYSHTFTTPSTSGLYRTEIKCTTNGETLALDKSFEVKQESALSGSDVSSAVWNADRSSYSASGSFGETLQNAVPDADDIASSVWSYSSRTLSTFGSLITDIWANPTRSLTSFGTLISDIWASATRTLTGADLSSGKLATQSDVTSVKDEVTGAKSDIATVKSDVSSIKDTVGKINATTTTTNVQNIQYITNETRNYLEQIINQPTVNQLLEEVTVTNMELSSKVDKSNSLANQMLNTSLYIKSKTNLISSKWENMGQEKITASLSTLSSVLDSVFTQINWVKEQWDLPVASKLDLQAKKIAQLIEASGKEISKNGKNKSALKQVQTVSNNLDNLLKLIGNSSDSSKSLTLFGQIKAQVELLSALDKVSSDADQLIAEIGHNSKPQTQLLDQTNILSKQVASINKLPQVDKILSTKLASKSDQKQLKNKALSLRGIVEANKQFIAQGSLKPLSSLWLEEGSIVFKSLITNPSSLISQKVPLKYYLPKEVTRESITTIDDGLTISYDTEKDQYFVGGEFELAPKETKTFAVTVDGSIFRISDQDIATMRRQAEELSQPLKNTSYFAQGTILKTDIDAALDKIDTLQKNSSTPESKIKAYRESVIEYKAAKEKLEKLKEIATSAGSAGTLVGFVGGAQVIAVWGLVIIFIAGFVFLTLYMRTIRRGEPALSIKPKKPLSVIDEEASEYYNQERDTEDILRPKNHLPKSIIFLIVLLAAGLVSLSAVYALLNVRQNIFAFQSANNKSSQDQTPTQAVMGDSAEGETVSDGKDINIFVPKDSVVDVFSEPVLTSTVSASLKGSQSAKETKRQDNWVRVSFEGNEGKLVNGWVDGDFVENQEETQAGETEQQIPSEKAIGTPASITITDTPTGFLRVRSSPGGEELTRVNPSDTYPLIQKDSGWVQIVLEDGTLGWVSEQYVK